MPGDHADMTTIAPLPGALFRQIVEQCPSDPDIDPSALDELSLHGVLGEWLGLLPADCRAEPPWRDQLRAVQLVAMRLAGTGAAVSAVLSQAGIPHVIYKGVATAALLGAPWNLRQSADVDILTPHRDLTRALAALGQAGWEVHDDFHVPNRVRGWAYCELTLVGPGTPLDLHWRLNASPLELRTSVDELIDAGVEVAVGQSRMRTLSPEHTALVTAVHGTREFWWQAKWLLDLARCFRVVDPWALRRSAPGVGAEKALAIGCAALFEVAPDSVPPALQPGPEVIELWQAMSQRPLSPLRSRTVKTRSAESLASGLDTLARSVVRQVVSP